MRPTVFVDTIAEPHDSIVMYLSTYLRTSRYIRYECLITLRPYLLVISHTKYTVILNIWCQSDVAHPLGKG